jgi:signal transduction histidine kinase
LDSNGGHRVASKQDFDPSSGSRLRAAPRDRRALADDPPRVLIVSDESDSARALADAALELGCEVTGVACDLPAAEKLAREHRPDLVVMDLRPPPGSDTLATAQRFAFDFALPAVLVCDPPFATAPRLDLDFRSVTALARPPSLDAMRAALEGCLLRRALELRALEQDFSELAFDALPEAVLVCDAERRVRAMNHGAEHLTGSDRGVRLGSALEEVLEPLFPELEPLSSALARCLTDGTPERVRLSPSPRTAAQSSTLTCTLTPIVRKSESVGAVLAFTDAAFEQTLDEQLASTAHLDALGALVAGLAHEMNTPLAVNLVNLELASRRVAELGDIGRLSSPEVARLTSVLGHARIGGERIDRLIRELRAYARSEQHATRAIDPRGCARWALRFIGGRLEHAAKVTLELGETPLVLGNEFKLSRVLVHLLVNATHAVQSAEGNAEVRVTTGTDAEGRAIIEVFDTGPRVPDELADRIFDPYFNGHPRGKGGGFGLRVSREIIESLGGTLSFQSIPEFGTTFRVTLPASDAKEAAPRAVELVERSPHPAPSYAALIESSEQVAWKLSDVFPPTSRLDFALPHSPEFDGPVAGLVALDRAERLKLNQLRAFAHVNVLGLIAEVSVAERLRHAVAEASGDAARVRALLRSSEEGLKHQRLFSLYAAAFERDFGSPCRCTRNTADIANVLLSHSPLAVVLSSLHFTLATQRHYTRCVQGHIEPLVESILRHQFVEATQHAELDRLELERAARGLGERELEHALVEYTSILDTVDDLLNHEAKLSVENLERALARGLSTEERAALVAAEHEVHRRVFLETPLRDDAFRGTLSALLPKATSHLDRSLEKLEPARPRPAG